jgi:hypothetical protein|tara:strand:- start:12 stop:1130 length:1119 start_codon:yes stop_codon:yes gene_type:complete
MDVKYYLRNFILFLFLFLFNINFIFGLGISPSKHVVDYVPGLELEYDFTVYASADQKVELYALGDFNDSVVFDKESFIGTNSFHASVKLPLTTKRPGKHVLLIGSREVSVDDSGNSVGASAAVQVPIVIRVPYPGKYAEINFVTNNVNQGDDLEFIIDVNSRGSSPINAQASIEILRVDGESVERLDLGSKEILNQDSYSFKKIFETDNYEPGDYNAVAIVSYVEGIAKAESLFRLGRLFVNITNYTSEVVRDGIKPFQIDIESLWNDPIENVHAEVYFSKEGKKIADFLTPSFSLTGWEVKSFTGYFDTDLFDYDIYDTKIILNYENQTIVNGKLLVVKEENNFKFYLIILGIVLFCLGVFFMIFRGFKIK